MPVTAIVPLKALDDAKQRLSGRLTVGQRRAFMRDVFLHVIDVCLRTAAVERVVAVVGDDAGAVLADERGVDVVHDPGGGLNNALVHAVRQLPSDATSLVVVADLPELQPDDLTALIALSAADAAACVLLAPTHDGGTGALLRHPADIIAPAFGVDSAAAHLSAAQRAGVRAGMLWRAGLARDVDRPRDLDRYAGLVPDSGHP